MLDGLLMKELLLVLCKISRKEEYVGPFLPKLCPQGKNLNYKKLRKFDFISFPHLKNSVGVKSLFYLLSERYRKCAFQRTQTLQKNRDPYKLNELPFQKNLHSVFPSYLDKNLSMPHQMLEEQEIIRHLLLLCSIIYSAE